MQLPFWKDLTERERETVQRSAVTRRYEKGALIHDGGSECLGLVLVLSGELRTYLLSDEGREVTLFRLYAGDLCVLSASCVISQITFDTQMTAQRDTEVLIIPANIVAMLKEQNLAVRCCLYELATARFSDVMWALTGGWRAFSCPKRSAPALIRSALLMNRSPSTSAPRGRPWRGCSSSSRRRALWSSSAAPSPCGTLIA